MPSRTSHNDTQVVLHITATDVLAAVEHLVLPQREREANIWLPHARKIRDKEASLPLPAPANVITNQFWLSLWSTSAAGTKLLDFVVTCTSHHLGNYPLFLYANLPSALLSPAFLSPRVSRLVERLSELVSSSRVFSVYGPVPLTTAFVSAWSRRTGVTPEPEAFYAAKFTTCTSQTLAAPRTLPQDGDVMRLAEDGDLEAAAVLCKEFADDSVYFPLTLPRAVREAQEMIHNRQLWVYYTTLPDGRRELASIVATTRTSENVVAITKVFTSMSCRSRGCAERLVRRVCDFWLNERGRQYIVLFVAHENGAAETVYHRVGFQGLKGRVSEGVEDWVEIGFANTERGHW